MFVSSTYFLLHEAFPLLQIFQFRSGVFRLTCIYTHHRGRVAAEEGNRKKFACSMLFCSVRIYPCGFKTRFCFACFPWTSVRRKMPCIMSLKNKSLRFPVNRASQTFILSDATSGILRHFRAQLEHSSFSRQQRSFFRLTPCRKPSLFPYAAPPWIEHPVRGAEAFVERGNVHGQCSGRRSVPEGHTDGRREIRDKSTAGTGFRKH